MKLIEYCESKNITVAAFARKIGEPRQIVQRFANGERLPRPELMRAIALASEGHVLPNDFYDLAGVPQPLPEFSLLQVPTRMIEAVIAEAGPGRPAS